MRSTFHISRQSLAIAACLLSACSRLSVEGSALTRFDGERLIAITSLQSLAPSQWRADPAGRAYVTRHQVDMVGTCARGVSAVQAYRGSEPVGAQFACSASGEFHWSVSLPDGEYALQVVPVLERGRADAVHTISQTIVVDTTPPAAPVIVTNQGQKLVTLNSRVSLEGDLFSDAVVVQAQGDGILSQAGGGGKTRRFTYDVALTPGQTATVKFAAVDFAGNQSPWVTMEISHLATVELAGGEFVALAGPSADAGAPAVASSGGRLEIAQAGMAAVMTNQPTVQAGATALWSAAGDTL